LTQKRKKKIAINCNEVFTSIESVKAAQEEQERAQAAWNTRDRQNEAIRTTNIILANEI
jgi:hypothetical protein